MESEINIIKEIIDNKNNFEHSVILTYNCVLNFYEKLILRNLVNNGCYNNSIIMDSNQYRTLISEEIGKVKYCGNLYSCDYMAPKKSFHPKIIFLTGPEHGLLMIGSGNNTFFGYGKNYELFYKFEYSQDKDQHLYLFQQVLNFIENLNKVDKFNRIIKKKLKELKDKTPWLNQKFIQGDEMFIHNLDTPIIDQIIKNINDEIHEIVLLSPYFDPSLKAVLHIKSAYPMAKIKIITQSGNTNFPLDYFLKYKKQFQNVDLHKFKLDQKDNRLLHAKMLYFKGTVKEYLFTGSANISRAALLSTPQKGNVEAGVMVVGNKNDNLSSLWHQYIEDKNVTQIKEFETTEIKDEKPFSKSNGLLFIKDACREGSKISFDYLSSKKGKAQIIINGEIISKQTINDKGSTFLILPQTFEVSDQVMVLELRLGQLSSNQLWINNLYLKRSAEFRQVNKNLSKVNNYIFDIERIIDVENLLSPASIKKSSSSDFLKNNAMVSQEDGEELELPPDRYFVEEKEEYQNYMDTIKKRYNYQYTDDIFSIFSSQLSPYINRVSKQTPVMENDTKNNNKVKLTKSLTFSEISDKIKSKIEKNITNFTTGNNILDFENTIRLNRFLAYLVLMLDGIKLKKDDDSITLYFPTGFYIDSSIALLKKLWLESTPRDYLEDILKQKKDYEFLTMINIFSISLLIISFNSYLLRRESGLFDQRAENEKELVKIFLAIHAKTKRIPAKIQAKMFDDDKINNIMNKLFRDNRFWNHLSMFELSKVNIKDKGSFIESINMHNETLNRKIIDQLENEIEKLSIDLKNAKTQLDEYEKYPQKIQSDILGYGMIRSRISKIEDEIEMKNSTKKSELTKNKYSQPLVKVPKSIKQFFHI